jgi:hypothetical protein
LKPIDQAGLEGPYPNGSFLLSDTETSFASILDETCSRLEDSRNRGALKRIRKMEELLRNIEDELDAVLCPSCEAAVPAGAPRSAAPAETSRGADSGAELKNDLL